MQKNTRATIAKPTKNDKWKKQWYFTKPIENNKIKEAIFQVKIKNYQELTEFLYRVLKGILSTTERWFTSVIGTTVFYFLRNNHWKQWTKL